MEDLLVALYGIVIGIGLPIGFASWLRDFGSGLRYRNNEIGRTDGREQRYRKRQKRRLWLSIIPFVRPGMMNEWR